MKIYVQGKDMEITAGIRQFVRKKVKRYVAKFGQKVLTVRVYLENIARKKSDPTASRAKVKLEIPGEDIVVEEESHEMYQAIAQAIKSAARQLRKLKDKRLDKTRNHKKH